MDRARAYWHQRPIASYPLANVWVRWPELRALLTRRGVHRTPTEWLLAGACLVLGASTISHGYAAGYAGIVAGGIMASEVLFRRATIWSALITATAIGLSAGSSPTQNLAASLLLLSALTLPLHRPGIQSLILAQVFWLAFTTGTAGANLISGGELSSWNTLLNVVVFNAIVGVGVDLANRRRTMEHSLADQTKHTRELADALHHAEVLRAGTMALRDDQEAHVILEQLARTSRELAGADVAQILVASTDNIDELVRFRRMAQAAGYRAVVADACTSWSLRRVLERHEIFWLLDPTPAEARELQLEPSTRVIGLIPVLLCGHVYAVLELGRRDHREFSLEERSLAVALAEQAGVAFERASLRMELAQRASGAEMLHRLSAALAGQRDIAEIAAETIAALRSLYQADSAVFYLAEPAGLAEPDGAIKPVAVEGITPTEFAALRAAYAGERRGVAIQQGRARMVEHDPEDRRLQMRELLSSLDIAKVVEVPVISRGRVIGGIVLYHHQHRNYQPYELELLETFAEQLGGGIGLAQAYEAVNALDQQREEFLALVSHDLRQPVVAISIVAEALAANTRLTDVERRSLDGLLDQARSLARFANDVLSVSLAESGQFKLRPVQFDLGLLIAGLARQSSQAQRIELDMTEQPLFINGDPDRIAQAIENLLHNAFKYSAPETPVVLRVQSDGDRVVVEVCDSGIGLDPEDMQDLFQKYGRPRLDATRGQASFGLGLYLCRLLVATHGGAISAHSAGRGHGATFRIALPLESCIVATSLVPEAA